MDQDGSRGRRLSELGLPGLGQTQSTGREGKGRGLGPSTGLPDRENTHAPHKHKHKHTPPPYRTYPLHFPLAVSLSHPRSDTAAFGDRLQAATWPFGFLGFLLAPSRQLSHGQRAQTPRAARTARASAVFLFQCAVQVGVGALLSPSSSCEWPGTAAVPPKLEAARPGLEYDMHHPLNAARAIMDLDGLNSTSPPSSHHPARLHHNTVSVDSLPFTPLHTPSLSPDHLSPPRFTSHTRKRFCNTPRPHLSIPT